MRVGARTTMAPGGCGSVGMRGKRIPRARIRQSSGPTQGMAVAPRTGSMLDLARYLSDCKFILVSNREPYEHFHGEHGIEVKQPAGGLVSALDPTMRRTHGTWVAWGSGEADRAVSD